MKLNEKLIFQGREIYNRVVFQPMEGCDCNTDGSPSEFTKQKYRSFIKSKAGIVWFEANAVTPEGRTNPRQMMLTRENLPVFQEFLRELKELALRENGFVPLMFIQLTHSGRQSIKPIIAYRNPVYEATRPVSDGNIATDEYLDGLVEKFVLGARLAEEAGFDGLDMKSCHGYLLQELLSAYQREGKYGGTFENRTRLYLTCVKEIKKAVSPNFIVTSRLGVTDMVQKPYGFGTTEENELDLSEAKLLIQKAHGLGIDMINITLGNPYFNPHVNRPFRAGPYKPEERAEVGLERFKRVGKELKDAFPDILFVNSGLSYYRGEMMSEAEKMLEEGMCDLVGFGRVTLAYPEFYSDYLSGKFDAKKCCVTCSKCTALMRNHQIAGCAVFNEYYRNLYNQTVAKK